MTKEKECIEWTSEGSCAKWKYSEKKGLAVDLKACKKEEKEKIIKEIGKGVVIEDD